MSPPYIEVNLLITYSGEVFLRTCDTAALQRWLTEQNMDILIETAHAIGGKACKYASLMGRCDGSKNPESENDPPKLP